MLRNMMIGLALVGLAGCGGIGNAQNNLRSAVDTKKPTLDDCYATALEGDAKAAGSMTVKLTVGKKSGTIDKVDVVDPGFADHSLQGCVEGALTGVALDPKPKANLEVEYTLDFRPKS